MNSCQTHRDTLQILSSAQTLARTYLQGVYHNYIPLTMQYLIGF